MQNKYTIEYIKEKNLILFECIGGSHAYGTNVETSDVDIRGVYIAEFDDVLTGNYLEQINDSTNDTVYYELSRFLNLVMTNNPNILEFLNSPEDCVNHMNPLFQLIIDNKNNFITKTCKNSFGGYALQQIKKAKGLNKKQNWEKDKVIRKDLLDFVYVIENGKSIPWKVWSYERYDDKFCGVVKIPNARDVYAVYYDGEAEMCHSERYDEEIRNAYKESLIKNGMPMGFGYKGLVKTGEGKNIGESNQLRLSSVIKGEKAICNIFYNKDGYSEHCKDYKEYQEWLKNRNETRYVETQEHGQRIDGKNMMHCIRLIKMVIEIGEGKGIIVRRDDAKELLAIRHGEVDLESLIEMADNAIKNMDEIFDNSNLIDKVDKKLIESILLTIRKKFYNLKI